MANRRFIDFPIAASVGDNDIVLIWQDGLNKQTTKATLLQGSPSSLAGLTDVDIAALTNGQILQYNSTTSKWENVDRTDINLSELGDVTIVAPANGQVLVYNSSTSKWENSSAGYVPYTGAVTTVNLGAQSILAGSFVKAGGTSAQFLKADGSVDSSTYGTGTVTSVALTMPTAFSVANSPVTTAGTLAVTATGTTSQYIRGDGSLETFPALTGFVPYTGATADVNLGTFDLLAERGTFENNGSSNTLTVNHTSGSGYGIIVTKGGNNEALYVSKTSGSGNAMTVVGGRTSLVDLALSSVTNTAGDFLTLSGGVVHKRTAAQTLTDIGGQAALTNPVTGTGTTNYLPKFTGSTTIGNSTLQEVSGNLGLGVNPSSWSQFKALEIGTTGNGISGFVGASSVVMQTNAYWNGTNWIYANTANSAQIEIQGGNIIAFKQATSGTAGNVITYSQPMTITSGGNVGIGTNIASQPLQIGNGLLTGNQYLRVFNSASDIYLGQTGVNLFGAGNGQVLATDSTYTSNFSIGTLNLSANLIFGTANIEAMRIFSGQNVHIGPTPASDAGFKLDVNGTGRFSGQLNIPNNIDIAFGTRTGNYIGQYYNGTDLLFYNGTGGASFFGINRGTGAAFFSGDINPTSNNSSLVWSGSGNKVSLNANNGILDFYVGTSSYFKAFTLASTGAATFSSTVLSTRFLNPSGPYGTGEANARNHFTQFNAGNAGIASGWISGAFGDALGDRIVIGQYSGVAVIAGHSANLDAWANMALATGGGNVLIGTTTSGASKLRIVGLPTSAAGLSSGDVYNLAGVLMIA
jgi:uncharacterized protein YaiE (UPF0345 family)